ncbi:MAG: VWA domain-containing protein [Gammaproteobacteria bacterium]|nr:VWA domain-containing protein [Gammaproteobacteria bacterium]
MKRIKNKHLLGIVLGLFIAATGLHNALATQKSPLDALVIMDSSGSMKKTDPRELRKPAAKLFITLLGNEDKLSVVSFSSQAWPITFLTQLNTETNKDKAIKATDRVSSKGIYTNIHAAIVKGIDMLKASKALDRDPIIVLMSDGKMDVGDANKSTELRQQIFDELIPQLKQHHIKIYSIAFTENSDQTLLQEIADATEGRYALAASDDVLHKVFAKIFEQSKEPNLLPLSENQFVVDPSIREITIIANKKSDQSKIYLESPGGHRYNSNFKKQGLKWFESPGFDMITLSKPEAGNWKILFSDDDNKAYIVADIKLRTQFEYNTESYYPELMIKTWFDKDDATVSNNELLNNMELVLEIEHPDGSIDKQDIDAANADGIFTTRYKPTMDGIYAASIIATSKTFQRQQIFSFRAVIPKQPPPEPEPEIETTEEIKSVDETKTEVVPIAEPAPAQQEPEDDLTQALIYFLIGNLILLFLGVNGFLIFRMMKNKKTSQ